MLLKTTKCLATGSLIDKYIFIYSGSSFYGLLLHASIAAVETYSDQRIGSNCRVVEELLLFCKDRGFHSTNLYRRHDTWLASFNCTVRSKEE